LERREDDEREEVSDEFEKVSNKRSAGGKVGGKGGGKGSGNGGSVKASSTSLRSDIVVDQEDNTSLIRLIKNKVGEYRERSNGDRIARALISPVNGITGEREKLRFLQHARNVATNTLFKPSKVEVGVDDSDQEVEDRHDRSSSTSGLLSRRDPNDSRFPPVSGETMMEALMSMTAVQSVMIVVRSQFIIDMLWLR
jgi:hypothetical protein